MKINLDSIITDLKGQPFKMDSETDLTLGKMLSSALDSGKETGRMKLFILAKKCYEGGIVEFDEADISLMKRLLENSTVSSNVAVGQGLLLLETQAK